MIKTAILSGDIKSANLVANSIEQFAAELNEICKIKIFNSLIEFFGEYKSGFDVIILDTFVSEVTGVQIAKLIRDDNDKIPLIFISETPDDAIYGFTYNAIAYLLKPVNVKQLYSAWSSALNALAAREPDQITVSENGVLLAVDIKKLYKVTVSGHYLYYHTDTAEYVGRGVMKECEARLAPYGFVRCNHSPLINLRYVTSVSEAEITIEGEKIPISHKKAKSVRNRFKNNR